MKCMNCGEEVVVNYAAPSAKRLLFMGDEKPQLPATFYPAECKNGHRYNVSQLRASLSDTSEETNDVFRGEPNK